MAPPEVPLIIPVENQVRELDPKLLLACVAAERGFRVIIGSRSKIDSRIASLPRGIYLSKSMTPRSIRMFGIMRRLGHQIAAWDEEALVHLEPEHYFARRLSPVTLGQLMTLFAWGEENAEMFRKYPEYPATPIYVTGNPRGDMLRPEMRPIFEEQADQIRSRQGSFILLNTNFAMVNAFLERKNLLRPGAAPGEEPRTGAYAVGLTREFVEGLAAHKRGLFDAFQRLLPALENAFPNLVVVVRPHPVENFEPWEEVASRCDRVRIVQEGNVIPWLLAARAVIHNGCTTGLEAFVLRVPAIAYQPLTHDRYDFELPNALSHRCLDFGELRETLERILRGELGSADAPERRELLGRFLSAQDGPLASDRIVDVLEASPAVRRGIPAPRPGEVLSGWLAATRRRLVKERLKPRLAGRGDGPAFQRQRFPGLSIDELRNRIDRFARQLGRFATVKAERVSDQIFHLHA